MTAVEKNIMRPRGSFEKREPKEYDERVIEINRVSRVVKGGRRIRFRALVVIGNHNGKIGMGIAKATEVSEAVKKATALAKKHVVLVPIINGTIPHETIVKHGGARILLKPATEGTSIVAGGSIRSVADLVGITDLLSKSLGSSNKINSVTATIKALSSFNPDIVAKVRKAHENSKPKGEPVAIKKDEVKVEENKKEVSEEKSVIKKTVKDKKAAAKKK
ncbi:MAG: 30S ribosomal protein S5 [Patescibacteria group bacterium]